MARVYSKALGRSMEVDRLLGQVQGSLPGPSLIFTAGIHGNEPAGLFALQAVMQELQEQHVPLRGNVYALSGNLWALERAERYQQNDLNRLWTDARMEHLTMGQPETYTAEHAQQQELYACIKDILSSNRGPFYFMDLHTTSGNTSPFLTVNDSMLNRRFTRQYPVPLILGIEEYLQGPLLSYLNLQGFVSFGFEAGQHDAPQAIENHIAFIYLSLAFAASIDRQAMEFDRHYQLLARRSLKSQAAYEIIRRYEIQQGENFRMLPGFSNFQPIRKGQELAVSEGRQVQAPCSGKIFMPLYQKQGDDGFFIIRRVPSTFLRLSAWIRKIGFDRFLTLLPGIRWASEKQDKLRLNLRVARFFAKEIFHLLGYRSRKLDATHLLLQKRDVKARSKDYQNEPWNQREMLN